MTNIQQKLEEINSNYQKIENLQILNNKLNLELSELMSEEIKTSKILENSIWEVHCESYDPANNINIINKDLNIFNTIQQYKNNFYEFMLGNLHIDLHNSVRQTSLVVSEMSDFVKFVSEFKIKLITTNLDQILNNYYNQIKDLEKLKHIISSL